MQQPFCREVHCNACLGGGPRFIRIETMALRMCVSSLLVLLVLWLGSARAEEPVVDAATDAASTPAEIEVDEWPTPKVS